MSKQQATLLCDPEYGNLWITLGQHDAAHWREFGYLWWRIYDNGRQLAKQAFQDLPTTLGKCVAGQVNVIMCGQCHGEFPELVYEDHVLFVHRPQRKAETLER